jgi:hypothetical protein
VNENEFRLDADWTEFYGDVWEEDPPDMPEPLGSVDHAGNIVTRKSHSGIMISVNNALIKSFSKMQNTMESSTYDSEMVAMRLARDFIVEMSEGFHCRNED